MLTLSISGAVATVTLCRPPVNALSVAWIDTFHSHLDSIATHPNCALIHIRSDQKVFCAGADLNEMRGRMASQDGADRSYAYVASLQRLFARIERLPQVTLAEIGGAAMGGGLELALACDLRLATDDAKVGLPEARLGLIPGAGGTQRLTRLCGPAVAARLILGAEVVDGVTAATLGVVHWALPRTELAQRAAQIVANVGALPAGALAASKACIAAAGHAERGGFIDELEFTRQLMRNAETLARVEAFLAGTAGSEPKAGVVR